MMRSMFSAVSGLSAHQLKMDTIGNNIANVNTVGFKGNRTTFQEVFTQTIRGAGGPQNGLGGTNPRQVGLGIDISSMDTFHIQGAVERTDYVTDMMINGDGFFMVSDDPNFANRSYTRAGNFSLDGAGNLVTANGERVLGYRADQNGVLGNNIEGLQISRGVTFPPQATTEVEIGGTLNSRTEVSPDAEEIFNIIADPDTQLTDEQRASIADRQTIQVYDSLGALHTIEMVFVKTGEENEYQLELFTENAAGDLERFDNGPLDITFDGFGQITQPLIPVSATMDGQGGANEIQFTLDLSEVRTAATISSIALSFRNGYSQGALEDFSVSQTGEIIGNFDNGQRRILGQLAIASFTNPAGLEKVGGNNFRETANSGNINVGNPGTQGLGVINSGALEMSNVDLSKEFTDMITTQRGFQANSRIITTSDEMLQEVVNMKR